ncbi:DUF2971 domain-containing protein [Telluria sp. B2]
MLTFIYGKNMSPNPKLLYHYTNQIGLLGILSRKQIWATSIHYLNDTQEFWHAFEMAKVAIASRIRAGTDPRQVGMLSELREEISTLLAVRTCVASFSAHRDSLGQWRGYVGNQPGFAIGFNFGKLQEIASAAGAELHPCIYEKDEQKRVVAELVESILSKEYGVIDQMSSVSTLDDTSSDSDEYEHLPHYEIPAYCTDFENRLIEAAPLLKHSAFHAEKEWRIVYHPKSDNVRLPLKHRPGQSMLIPYVEIDLLQDGLVSCIEEIVVGPCAYPELSCDSLRELLRATEKLKHSVIIGNSRAPFRYW